ncbi:MAG: hypothetical protein ACE5JL_05735, partial [Dehalococcoidia bacterium]
MDWLRLLAYAFVQRFRTSWVLLTLSAFAILASVTMVAAAYIYSQAQGEGALRQALASTSEESLHTRVMIPDRPLGPSDYDQLEDVVNKAIGKRIGWLRDYQHRWGRTQEVGLAFSPGESPSFFSPSGVFSFRTGLREHTELVAGRWPDLFPLGDSEADLEIAVASEVAGDLVWDLGSMLYLVPFIENPNEFMAMEIVGLVRPVDPDEMYWLGDFSEFAVAGGGARSTSRRVAPLIVSEEAFFSRIGGAYPFFSGDFGWDVFIDPDRVPERSGQSIRRQIGELEADINKQFRRSLVITGLDALLV